MRYLISVIDTATGSGNADEMASIDAFNERLHAQGHWVLAGGLTEPQRAQVIDDRGGAGAVHAGPLHDTKEYVSGFWVIEAQDEATAERLALEGSRACHRKVELRPFLR